MISAYELMLVLRGRNYLSNDLRRAGADIGRLKSISQLKSAREQLGINAQRLAGTRKIAQEEMKSVTIGVRRVALNKAIAAQSLAQETAVTRVHRAEEALEATQRQQLTNQANLSRLSRNVARNRPARGFNMAETQNLFQAAQIEQQRLMSVQATNQRALEESQKSLANMSIAAQGLTEREAALIERQSQLTAVINTTNAALKLNTEKLNDNALAIKRQPFEKFAAVARFVQHLGRAFQTLGLVSAVALGIAAHSAAAFQTQLTLASTQATLVGDRSTAKVLANSRTLQKDVQKMLIGGQTSAKPSDLSGGLYTIFSGITLQGSQKKQLRDGIDILKEFNKVYTANFGQVAFNDVTKAGVALINNFGLSAKSIPPVMNQMQASVRFGAMTMGEMTSSLNQVIPAFKSAGFSTKQMFTDIAFVSRLFPSLRVGTTGLARLTEVFAKYHDAISQDVGKNIAPNGKLSPIASIAEDILKAHPTFIKGGVDLQNYLKTVTGFSGTVQARRALTAYITNMHLYHTIARQVGGDTKELDKSFRDMSQTPQVRWAEFTNQLKGLSMEIGASVIPIFQKLAKPVEEAVKWFDKLSPATKKTIGTIAAWTTIGLLFGGTALVVVGALGRMYAAMRLLLLGRAGVAALEGGFIGAGTALRLGLIGALIIAVPLLVKYHTQVMRVVNALGGMKTVLGLIVTLSVSWKIAALIQGIAKIGTSAIVAQGEVTGLRAALLGLTTLDIVVPIVVTVVGTAALIKLMRWAGHGIPAAIRGSHDSANVPSNPQDWSTNFLQAMTMAGPNTPYYKSHPGLYDKYYRILSQRRQGKNTSGMSNDPMHDVLSGRPSLQQARASIRSSVPAFNVNAAIANVEKLRAISQKTPTMANFLAYEKAKTALEKHFTGDALTALQDYLSQIESVEKKSNRKRLSEAKKAAAERLQALKDAAANAMSMYDQILGQNQSILGSLFNGPFINSPAEQNRLQFGGKFTGTDYLNDLKSQTKQFTTFYSQIGKLQKRGAPQELINELIQAGPQALPAIKALSNMGDSQWGQYIKVFKHGQDLLHKQTITQLTAQLKDYRKYGEKVALQIISGMRDKRLGLANEIKSIIKSIFGVNVPTTHAPSRTRTTQHTTEHHTHYHVTAPKTQHASIKTQLRHANFAAKSKYERTR